MIQRYMGDMTHRQRDTEGTGLSASPPRRLAALTSLLIFFTRPALSLSLSLALRLQ